MMNCSQVGFVLVMRDDIHQLTPVPRAGLEEDVSYVELHGALGDAEFSGDGPVGKLAESQVSDLNFASREQPVEAVIDLEHGVGVESAFAQYARRDVELAVQDIPHGATKLRGPVVLQADNALHARKEEVEHVVFLSLIGRNEANEFAPRVFSTEGPTKGTRLGPGTAKIKKKNGRWSIGVD